MKVLILAAGYATRLYPLTRQYPKPLLLIGQTTMIDHIIAKLADLEEIDEIIVVTNSKFIAQFRKWARGLKINKRLNLVDDLTESYSRRRGAIGDMYFAVNRKKIRDDLLVIGGDNLFDGDLRDFLCFARSKRKCPLIGVYDIKNKKLASKYGVVKLDKKNRIIDFQEKPARPKTRLVAMCLYYFPKEKLPLIKRYFLSNLSKKCDATGYYIDWLRKKENVYGFKFSGRWYDIGHRANYRAVKDKF